MKNIMFLLFVVLFIGCATSVPLITDDFDVNIVPGPDLNRVASEETQSIMFDNGSLSFYWWVDDYEGSPEGGILFTITNKGGESNQPTGETKLTLKSEGGEKEIKPLSIYLRVFDYKGDKEFDNPRDRIEYDTDGDFFILTGDFRSNWSADNPGLFYFPKQKPSIKKTVFKNLTLFNNLINHTIFFSLFNSHKEITISIFFQFIN